MNTTISDAQNSSHPFSQILDADEPLLWLARPNADAFRAQQAKIYLYAFGFGGIIFSLRIWPFKPYASAGYAAFALITFAIGIILANKTAQGDEEWSITWYALTPRRLLKQSLDTDAENGRRLAQVNLTDLRRLRLRKRYIRLSTSVGTITCYTSARFVREHLTFECIENPDEVIGLIKTTVVVQDGLRR